MPSDLTTMYQLIDHAAAVAEANGWLATRRALLARPFPSAGLVRQVHVAEFTEALKVDRYAEIIDGWQDTAEAIDAALVAVQRAAAEEREFYAAAPVPLANLPRIDDADLPF